MLKFLDTLSSAAGRGESFVARLSLPVTALIVFIAALIPRLYFAVTSMGPVACDEIFQSVEVGHKIAFGRGFLYWEWTEGVRSYVMPGFFAGIYRMLDLFGVRDPYLLTVGVKSVLAILHAAGWVFLFLFFALFLVRARAFLIVVASGFLYVGAFVAVRTLGEAVSIPFLLAALYFTGAAMKRDTRKDALYAGLFAGIAFAFRFQSLFFSAGLFLVLLIAASCRRPVIVHFAGGFLAILSLIGILDLLTWGDFLHSLVRYVDFNVVRDGASRFGREKWSYYFAVLPKLYSWPLIIPAVLAMAVGLFSRRFAALIVPMALYTLLHVIVPHKEVRFLFPVYVLFGVIALFAWERLSLLAAPRHRPLAALIAVAIPLFLATGHTLRMAPTWAQAHPQNNAENMEPSFALGRIPDIKKGFVLDLQQDFSGGHAYFHANADIQYLRFPQESRGLLSAELGRNLPGRYFALRKKDERLFSQYLPFMEKIDETPAWDIYRRKKDAVMEPITVLPEELSRPKRAGAAWDAPGTVRVTGSGIRIPLGAVRNDTALELSADNNDQYELRLQRGKMVVGRLEVLPQKGKDGLVLHRLTVPRAAVEQGYDTIIVIPSDGDGVYSVGHLILSR
jgi:hypothetical protein